MTGNPEAALLPDGRLHLHHGPIDLIVTVEGVGRDAGFARATARFETVLAELVAELDHLTLPYDAAIFGGAVAKRMARAVAPLAGDGFVTPMAAVAGSVADEVLAVMRDRGLTKVIVNNGGDIAFHLGDGAVFRAASPTGPVEVSADAPVRGLATSGWRGRSQSFGIADAVTVLARSAAEADVAATLIANRVDLPGHPAISRRPADEVEAIPQLGTMPVTADVGPLSAQDIATALDTGQRYAEDLLDRGLIEGATLLLDQQTRVIGSSDTATGLPADQS
ncbi:MAG: UPF0280 family protein [Pseudomonadota bacterium]